VRKAPWRTKQKQKNDQLQVIQTKGKTKNKRQKKQSTNEKSNLHKRNNEENNEKKQSGVQANLHTLNVPLVWFFSFVMCVCINNNNCRHQHGSALSWKIVFS